MQKTPAAAIQEAIIITPLHSPSSCFVCLQSFATQSPVRPTSVRVGSPASDSTSLEAGEPKEKPRSHIEIRPL